ncbi:hypothetical protein ACF0H5_014555 [Mactra antiquata]
MAEYEFIGEYETLGNYSQTCNESDSGGCVDSKEESKSIGSEELSSYEDVTRMVDDEQHSDSELSENMKEITIEPDSHVEYDDDAILTFNPKLKQAVERRQSLLLNNSRDEDSMSANIEDKLASGDRSSSSRRQRVITLTDRFVEDLRINLSDKIKRSFDNIKSIRNEAKTVKKDFSELHKRLKKTKLIQRRFLRSAEAHIKDLEFVIYQQNIIKHLEDSAQQIKLFDCHVTPDQKCILVDPDDFGTDVDTMLPVTDHRVNVIVGREFDHLSSKETLPSEWEVF